MSETYTLVDEQAERAVVERQKAVLNQQKREMLAITLRHAENENRRKLEVSAASVRENMRREERKIRQIRLDIESLQHEILADREAGRPVEAKLKRLVKLEQQLPY